MKLLPHTTWMVLLLLAGLPGLGSAGETSCVSFHQDFEAFQLGSGAGQKGWNSKQKGRLEVIDTGINSFGNRSMRYQIPGGRTAQDLVISEPIAGGYGTLYFDVLIDNTSSMFQVGTWDAGGHYQNTYLKFRPDGGISVFQLTRPTDITSFAPSTGHWLPGEVTRIGIEVLPHGELKIWQDMREVFHGKDMAWQFPYGGKDTGIGGLRIRTGQASGSSSIVIDNIAMVPMREGS